jgi:hypothetical protein
MVQVIVYLSLNNCDLAKHAKEPTSFKNVLSKRREYELGRVVFFIKLANPRKIM